jgi:plastocyanin
MPMRFACCLFAVLTAACSAGNATPTSPTVPAVTPPPASVPPGPSGPPTITITANGMNPLEITIAVGQRVLFVNNDVRAHDVVGGVDPANPECPEILIAGFLTPGQSRETGVFTSARTCNYHDHTALGVPAFSGKIIIR